MGLFVLAALSLVGRGPTVDRLEGGLAVVSAGRLGEVVGLCAAAREGRPLPQGCWGNMELLPGEYEFVGEESDLPE